MCVLHVCIEFVRVLFLNDCVRDTYDCVCVYAYCAYVDYIIYIYMYVCMYVRM